MKIGDMVKIRRPQPKLFTGVVLEIWRNHKKQMLSADLLFSNGTTGNINVHALEVISESR